jgi:hypothetical protein
MEEMADDQQRIGKVRSHVKEAERMATEQKDNNEHIDKVHRKALS